MEEEEKQEQEQDQSLLLEGGQQVEEGEPEPPQVRRFLISLLLPLSVSVSQILTFVIRAWPTCIGGATMVHTYSQEYPTILPKYQVYAKYTHMYM
jgi:hypothetical protein